MNLSLLTSIVHRRTSPTLQYAGSQRAMLILGVPMNCVLLGLLFRVNVFVGFDDTLH